MSFATWLRNYRGDQMIMNLASDAELNPPAGLWSHDDLRQHMRNCGAGEDAMLALEVAVALWQRERQRVAETQNSL